MQLNSTMTHRRFLFGTFAAVFAVLALLFFRSFLPGWVLAANDAQMGMICSDAAKLPGTLWGLWMDLEWVGIEYPGAPPDFSQVLGSLAPSGVWLAKFLVPAALLFLGLSAGVMARSLGFGLPVCVLTGIAAALNANAVSYACWGLPAKAMTLGCILLALATLNASFTGWRAWMRFPMAGFFTGLAVMEGGDVGAILSLYVGVFALWEAATQPGLSAPVAARRLMQIAILVLCAGWMAFHTVSTLVRTSIIGVSGMDSASQSTAQRWDFATALSLPLDETIRIVVPGIQGYRMDTPGGGAYWGRVGFDGSVEHRFNGGGEYAGIGVVLVGLIAVGFALSPGAAGLSSRSRKSILFWGALALVSLLVAYGRNAPFYRVVFSLPYFSTIRGPMKFLHGMHLCWWILFAYGVDILIRLISSAKPAEKVDVLEALTAWKGSGDRFLPRAVWTLWILTFVATAAAILYTLQADGVARYLLKVPFDAVEPATAAFSIGEVWWTMAFLWCTVVLIQLTLGGFFIPSRHHTFYWAMAVLVTLDLWRSNIPWVRYYDYTQRYEQNPVVDLLKERPWEHRVTAFLNPVRDGLLVLTQEFAYLQKEWLENHFPYNNVQSLDIDQMARMPNLERSYLGAFSPPEAKLAAFMAGQIPQLDHLKPEDAAQVQSMMPRAQASLGIVTRLWELTNTRYQLGWATGIERFNDLFDPVKRRFKVRFPYSLALKAGVNPPDKNGSIAEAIQRYTAVPSSNGPLAVIEFFGALPRAKLYSRWETITGENETLSRLRSPDFDPQSVVVIDRPVSLAPTNAVPGKVEFVSYAPRKVRLQVTSPTPAILLLNDRWHENWRATVDGASVDIMKANFLMRGVVLEAGNHTVEFRFELDLKPFWISCSSIVVALVLGCWLILGSDVDEKSPASA